MDPFTARLQEWQIFYGTVATACATLTGLLFVALSLNVEMLNRPENTDRILFARQTFSEFLLVLMVALIFLIPRLSPGGVSIALLALAAAWIVSAGSSVRGILRNRKTMPVRRIIMRGFGLSLAGAIGVLITAILLLFGYVDALYGMVFMLAALLASASRNAWSLLVEARGMPKVG